VAGIIFPVKLLLAIPQLIVLYVVQVVAFLAGWIGFWIIAFTGTLSPGIARFVHNALGWNLRLGAWLGSLRDEYPGFALEQPEYPARVTITEPTLERSRGLAVTGILWFLKGLLLIPHVIVLWFVALAAGIAGWIAFWAIAFTGDLSRRNLQFRRWHTALVDPHQRMVVEPRRRVPTVCAKRVADKYQSHGEGRL
jgi:hypothetical protein